MLITLVESPMYAYDLMGLHFEDERDLEKPNVESSTLIHPHRGLSAQM